MILINWLLGFGALAFTVPLAIHLLFRNRFELVDWGVDAIFAIGRSPKPTADATA